MPEEFNDYPDVLSAVGEGGAAYIVHDLRGRFATNVPARELAVFTAGAEMRSLITIVRDMERCGELPCVKFHRDPDGRIDGVTLCQATVMQGAA